jgi:hypothetical protein
MLCVVRRCPQEFADFFGYHFMFPVINKKIFFIFVTSSLGCQTSSQITDLPSLPPFLHSLQLPLFTLTLPPFTLSLPPFTLSLPPFTLSLPPSFLPSPPLSL